jgi:hypothetical protein
LQRRVQRRLAQLDDHQIVALLSQHQPGRLAMRVQRIDGVRSGEGQRKPASTAAGASRESRGNRPHIMDISAPSLASTYCVEIERRRSTKPAKESGGRHKRRARRSGTTRPSGAGSVGAAPRAPERELAHAG